MLSPVRGQLLAAAQMLRPKRQTLPTALARASAARLPRHEECARDGDPGLVLDVGEHARDDGLASSRVGVAQEPPHLKVAHRAVAKALVPTQQAKRPQLFWLSRTIGPCSTETPSLAAVCGAFGPHLPAWPPAARRFAPIAPRWPPAAPRRKWPQVYLWSGRRTPRPRVRAADLRTSRHVRPSVAEVSELFFDDCDGSGSSVRTPAVISSGFDPVRRSWPRF